MEGKMFLSIGLLSLFVLVFLVLAYSWLRRAIRNFRKKSRARRERVLREKRKVYFQINRPILFYNRANDILAVQLPATYETARESTADARRYEGWRHSFLIPDGKGTFIFADAEGNAQIERAIEGFPVRRYDELGFYGVLTSSGYIATFMEFVTEYNVVLIPDGRIFVPLASDSVIPYRQQESFWRVSLSGPEGLEFDLLRPQAPPELQG